MFKSQLKKMVVIPHTTRNAFRLLAWTHFVIQILAIGQSAHFGEALVCLLTTSGFLVVVMAQSGKKWNRIGFYAHLFMTLMFTGSLITYFIRLRHISNGLVEGEWSWYVTLVINPMMMFTYVFYMLGHMILQLIARDVGMVLEPASEYLTEK